MKTSPSPPMRKQRSLVRIRGNSDHRILSLQLKLHIGDQEIFWIGLFQQLDLPWSPSLVKPRLKRAIKPKNRVPTRARICLYPIILLASRRFRPEIDIHRTIGINQKPFSLTTDTRKLLIRLNLRSRLVAVKNN
jgi:hypothetical protein